MPAPASCRSPAPTPPPLGVTLHVASVGFGAVPVLGTMTLRLEPGAITCVLGASGIGKSTLLRLLAGDLSGDQRVDVDCRPECDDGQPLRGRVAWMDQRDLLLPWLDVEENVLLGARLRGETPDRQRARDLLVAVGMGGEWHERPHSLSTGMRQRVALVRTLMEQRPLILMDEPFAALDVLTRHRLQALSVSMLAGRTVALVTHDPAEAVRMADHILVLEGRPAQILVMPGAPGVAPRDPTAAGSWPALRALEERLGLHEAVLAEQAARGGA